jgi:PAS domain S-box-containing protein
MPRVADFIQKHSEEILQRYRASANGSTRPELLDVVPSYLSALARQLRDPQDAALRAAEAQLASSIRQGVGLDEILAELSLIGRCILQVWGIALHQEPPDPAELALLDELLNRTSSMAVAMFTQHLQHEAQLEQRYLRLLHRIATEALASSSDVTPLRQRLTDPLELIKEAMNAEVAAILLVDPDTGALTLGAWVGTPSQPVPNTLALGSSALANRIIASHDDPVYFPDASRDLGLGDALRDSGLHSVLATRLQSRNELFGAVAVGLDQIRPFSPREHWWLETLAGQLALLLDDARSWERLMLGNEELRRSEERFRGLVEQAVDGIFVTDANGQFIDANTAGLEMLGYSRDEILRLRIPDVLHERELSRLPTVTAEFASGRVARAEWQMRRKDGTCFDGEVVGRQLSDGRLQGIVRDISERKRAEQALRDSERRFRTMANAIPQLAWTARPDGEIDWFNQRWYDYTGTTPEQMQGRGWRRVYDPAALPAILERWKRSLATGEPFDMVLALRGGDGVFRPFLTRVVPLKASGGRVLQWFGTNTDVTEQVKTAEELTRSRQQLEDADRSKNQFLAMLSHELRNPLGPIRNSLFVLAHTIPGGDQARRAQEVIDRQVTHLARLVDDLLDVTRISRGKIQLQLESLDLTDVVRRTVEDHRDELARRGLDLELSLPDEPMQITGDRTRIAQVVGNLMGNAAKFTERGGTVTVLVTADIQLRQALLLVRDTGPGVSPEMLPRMFDMFTQADTTLDRSKGGLGLGLALVKGIAEIHGGTASGESEGLGKGTTITVRFPLEPVVPIATEPVAGARHQAPRRRVLVIEDNVDAAQSLREVLELRDNTVEVAFTGIEGLERARVFHPEVVLCDIGLPGMDGYEVARALRAEPTLGGVAIVALTGYAAPEDIDRSRAAGFDRLVAKPASMEKLDQILASLPGQPAHQTMGV